MNVRHFRWLFGAALVLEVVASFIFSAEPQTLGASAEWTSDGYRFAGGTTPWAVGFAVLIAALYVLLMYVAPIGLGKPLPGLFRRFLAFWLDFMLAMFVVAPIIGLLPLLMEWRRTGAFAWTFARTTFAYFDIPVTIVSVILTVTALLLYYAIPIFRHRPCPGACILGYQVLPDGETSLNMRRALLRCLLGFIAVSGAYVAPFVGRDEKQGKFWLDKVFSTRATLFP